MKLLKVSIYLNTDKREFKIKEIDVLKETSKQYKIQNGVVNKSKLNVITSIFRNSICNQSPTICYDTFCLEEDLLMTKDVLYSKVSERIRELSIGSKNLIDSLSYFDY